jgi:hypothetical protein
MCLAVVPHVTLAASLMRAPAAASLRHEAPPPGAVLATAETAPCHEPAPQPSGHPAPAAPLCCVIGCGLIAEAPAIALPSRAILWSRPALAASEPLAGRTPEPAKPPPRSGPARS